MIKIRSFTNGDIDSCVDLLKKGHERLFTRQRFEWLHLQNPLAPSIMVVAEYNHQIVGLFTAIKKYVYVNGKKYIGARDVDPVVHPDYRKQGIFSRLVEYSLSNFEEVDFHFNFANDVASHGYTRSGWKVAGYIPESVFQLHYEKLLSKRFLLYLASRLKNAGSMNMGIWMENFQHEQFVSLEACNQKTVAVLRYPEYLKWRYLDNPTCTYSFIVQKKDNLPIQILIGRYDWERKVFFAHDLLYRPSATKPSIDFAVNAIKQKSCHALRTWRTFCPDVRKKMITNPFQRKNGLRFMVKSKLGKNVPNNIFCIDNWLLTPGDLEFF